MASVAHADPDCTESTARLAPVLPPMPAMVPIPARMLTMNAALRLYGELYRRGADRDWVVCTIAALARETGYSRHHTFRAIESLQAGCHVQVKRRTPHGVPAFRLVRVVDD